MKNQLRLLIFVVGLLIVATALGQTPLGTAFTYQAKLTESGAPPPELSADFKFRLYDADLGGNQIGPELEATNVQLESDGAFTVDLDFGTDSFDGNERWLEIDVRSPHDPGDIEPYTPLSPRQPLMPVPYALYALNTPAVWNDKGGGDIAYLDGNVGIGIQTPQEKLHVFGGNITVTAEGFDPYIELTSDDELNRTTMRVKSLDDVGLAVTDDSDNPHFVVTQLGSVGIGTTTPTVPLEVEADAAGSSLLARGQVAIFRGKDEPGSGLYVSRTKTLTPFFTSQSIKIDGNTISATQTVPYNASMNLLVNDTRALRLEFASDPNNNPEAPNVISGSPANFAMTGIWGGTISGGGELNSEFANRVTDVFCTVGGGRDNEAGDGDITNPAGGFSTVSGGWGNTAIAIASAIGGGIGNTTSASGHYGTVSGGIKNTASGNASAIGGGEENDTSGIYAAIAGGMWNHASGDYSIVPGGEKNEAGGDYSFAGGRRAIVRDESRSKLVGGDQGTFLWADSTNEDFVSSGSNRFLVRASGGVWFGATNTPDIPAGRYINTSTGGYLSTGGTWVNSSSREVKENFQKIDVQDILKRVAALNLSRWNYKSEDSETQHIGPIAEEFAKIFSLGGDEKAISTVDADGVALAAIQGLHQLVKEKDLEIRVLKSRISRIEMLLAQMTMNSNGGVQ